MMRFGWQGEVIEQLNVVGEAVNWKIDKQILCGMRDRLSEAIRTAKISYYSSCISECGKDQRALFKVVNRMLGRQRGLTLPSHESLNAILNQFGAYFQDKIVKIRTELDGAVVEREFPDDSQKDYRWKSSRRSPWKM